MAGLGHFGSRAAMSVSIIDPILLVGLTGVVVLHFYQGFILME